MIRVNKKVRLNLNSGMKQFLCFLLVIHIYLSAGIKICGADSFNEKKTYSIQLLSTIDEKYAEKFLNQLKKYKIDAYLKKINGIKGKDAYRVRTGFFLSEKEAEKAAESMIRNNGINCKVVKIEPEKKRISEKKEQKNLLNERGSTEVDCSGAVSRVFKYLDEKGIVQITNFTEKIPEKYTQNILEVSVFPVCFTSMNLNKMVLKVETEGRLYRVRLKDVRRVLKKVPGKDVNAFCEQLKGKPLLLKYKPVRGEFDSVVEGTVYFRSGRSVGLEMVCRGIVEANLDVLPSFMQQAYRAAEKEAKGNRAGAWASNK